MNKQTEEFIQSHIDDDTAALLLAASRYPDIDVRWAAEQIEARQRLKSKLPEWYANPRLVMSGRVPAEQCSSELTARYKRTLVGGARSMCDMTGGMGVDIYYMSEGMQRVVYTERQPQLCDAARHNFAVLDRKVEVRLGDGRELPIPDVDAIYLDPARRANDGSRVYAIEDCEPNVLEWQDELMKHCNTLIVKLSPMIDITDMMRKMHNVAEVHIVAVKNECKEVLVKCCSGMQGETTIHCVDFLANGTMEYAFIKNDDRPIVAGSNSSSHGSNSLLYIYEPDVTLMKAQAFASLCKTHGVRQLDHDTRLFTADKPMENFPGRSFVVEETIPFSSKVLKTIKKSIPKANIATRNFPLTADELRRRTGICDGGDVYLFAATVNTLGRVLLKCRKTYSAEMQKSGVADRQKT